jgi:hypothetical protein
MDWIRIQPCKMDLAPDPASQYQINKKNIPANFFNFRIVPYGGVGAAWDLQEWGQPRGRGRGRGAREGGEGGGEGGPGPPDKERDKQSNPSKEGGNMEQEKGGKKSQA